MPDEPSTTDPATACPGSAAGQPLDVHALLRRIAAECGDDDAALVETHISWVLLAGAHAYKIRRPVRMPFLDFTAARARLEDCERELALNRRWAPALYLDVVAVFGPAHAPSLSGPGDVIDHAVRMRRFADDARLDRVAARGELDETLIDRLADAVASLHGNAPPAPPDGDFGSCAAIEHEVRGNLDALDDDDALAGSDALGTVRRESLARLARLATCFRARLRDGFVRECHGDLHLENVALVDGEVTPFDGVEFEPAFRWVDVASDLAFLLMDLDARGHGRLGNRLLNRYLQHTGDHALLAVLDHYRCYRAMVRAKVAALRAAQLPAGSGEREDDEARRCREQVRSLVALAARFCRVPAAPALVITHGVSGSGKSWLAERLAPRLQAVWLRADVERARLFAPGPQRYSAHASQATYGRLESLAALALANGFPVIVDATFLEPADRARFARLAAAHGTALRVLHLHAPRALLERRVAARAARGDDPSEADTAVLARQLEQAPPAAHPGPAPADAAHHLQVDTGTAFDLDAIGAWVQDPGARG